MTTAAAYPSGPERIPRTQDAVAAALSPAHRMEFHRQMGEATDDKIASVLRRWWTLVQVAADPTTRATAAEVAAGTAPGRSAAAVLREARERS